MAHLACRPGVAVAAALPACQTRQPGLLKPCLSSHSTFNISQKALCSRQRRSRQSWARAAKPEQDSPSPPADSSPSPDVTELGSDVEQAQAAGSATGARKGPKRQAESTDWIASAVTRRFGIGAGLAWVGFLAFGVISEQLKTRREVFLEESLTQDVESPSEVLLPSGVAITDLRVGGGSPPRPGDLLVLSLVGRVSGEEQPFLDTMAPGKKDFVLTFGARAKGGVTEGLLFALGSMRGGGRRIVRVPAELGFGSEDVEIVDSIGEKRQIAGGSELVYTVELKRVSIAPS